MTCSCEHETHRTPATQREALELATHRNAIAGQLETIAMADDKWMAVMRCVRCGALWAEDSMSSGHASLFYIYPIATDDAVAWLTTAIPLDPPANELASGTCSSSPTRGGK
jgi:hypothetical protein